MDSFGRKEINYDNYFTALIAYIHNNPIHHVFVNNIDDWPNSSWHIYISKKTTSIACDEVITWFESLQNFIKYH
jgi:putative transposase